MTADTVDAGATASRGGSDLGVREGAALDLDDMLARRFRLAPELRDRGASIAPGVASLMGAELGWDEARQAPEVEAYLATARLEYGVPAAEEPS